MIIKKIKEEIAKDWIFWFALIILFLIPLLGRTVPEKDPVTSPENSVLWISLESSINPGTADYIERAIAQAKAQNVQALVIEMDTPGGLLNSTRSIVKLLLNADIPVAVYVSPRGARAGSAGVFITLAGHVAAMAPGTNIGAAHPITGMGKDPEEEGGKHLAKKIENDTTAFIETIANQRNRNVKWAKDAVLESVSVTEEKALELKVIDFIANDRSDLLKKMNGLKIKLPKRTVILKTKGAQIISFEMNWKQYFVDLFSDPNIIYFLVIIAMLGIYLELSNPGAILPGVAAGLAIILILITAQSLPFNIAGIFLIVLGAVFFLLEVYVTSYGMLAVGGIICFVLGSLFLFDLKESFGTFGVSRLVILWSTLVMGAIIGATLYFITRAHLGKVSTGYEGLVGQQAVVVNDLSPEGKILIDGEYWNAQADQPISAGQKVEIIGAKDLKLKVRSLENKST